MTDRTLPSIGAGLRTRPAADTAPGRREAARPAVTRPAVTRPEALLGSPARAGMLLGASAAVYAVTLAGIAGLQSAQDATATAAVAPLAETVARTRAANDALEARIAAASGLAGRVVGDYERLGTDVAAYETRLEELAALVAEVQGSAAALPDRIRLPTVSVRGPVAGGSGRAPRTSGTSGGSGR